MLKPISSGILRNIILSLIPLAVILTGCELFETRKPERPAGKVEWNYFPITSGQTWDNLIYAFEDNENIDKYGSILSSDFRFYFDNSDVQDYNLPAFWDRLSELAMRGMISLAIEINLEPIEDKEDLIQADHATYNREYEIRKKNTQEILFAGNLTVSLRRENDGFWRVYRWEDFRKDSYVSWGRLKYEFVP